MPLNDYNIVLSFALQSLLRNDAINASVTRKASGFTATAERDDDYLPD